MAIPVFIDTTTQPSQLYHEWVRMYHYGHQVLPALAVTTSVLYGYTAIRRRSTKRSWLAYALASAVTFTMVPFTWAIMLPTNNELFRLETETKSAMAISSLGEATGLIKTWSQLHLLRSIFPLAGAAFGLIATLSGH